MSFLQLQYSVTIEKLQKALDLSDEMIEDTNLRATIYFLFSQQDREGNRLLRHDWEKAINSYPDETLKNFLIKTLGEYNHIDLGILRELMESRRNRNTSFRRFEQIVFFPLSLHG